jgi:hypothetical protein
VSYTLGPFLVASPTGAVPVAAITIGAFVTPTSSASDAVAVSDSAAFVLISGGSSPSDSIAISDSATADLSRSHLILASASDAAVVTESLIVNLWPVLAAHNASALPGETIQLWRHVTGGDPAEYFFGLGVTHSGPNVACDVVGNYTAGHNEGSAVSVVDNWTVNDDTPQNSSAIVTVAPGIAVSPPNTSVTPSADTVTFTASLGGLTGYTWSFDDNQTGATIVPTGPDTALYTCGGFFFTDKVDTIRVTDVYSNTITATVFVPAG